PTSTLFPYTTLFRSAAALDPGARARRSSNQPPGKRNAYRDDAKRRVCSKHGQVEGRRWVHATDGQAARQDHAMREWGSPGDCLSHLRQLLNREEDATE